jgi:hypothetical protein
MDGHPGDAGSDVAELPDEALAYVNPFLPISGSPNGLANDDATLPVQRVRTARDFAEHISHPRPSASAVARDREGLPEIRLTVARPPDGRRRPSVARACPADVLCALRGQSAAREPSFWAGRTALVMDCGVPGAGRTLDGRLDG